MEDWLGAALDYIPQWLDYQMHQSEQPGCVIVIAHRGQVVLERAFGQADIVTGAPLTPRHRFRVASHSKTFSAAGVLKLREERKIALDDCAGRYVEGLHPAIAEATMAQLLSHSAGIVRDGPDGRQWQDARPFLSEAELRGDLASAPTIDANTRFKYSNHGFGLIGLVIEAVTGASYRDWTRRAIIEPAGLAETDPDMPLAATVPAARGHSSKLPLGRRVVIPGDNPTNALAAATGFVSTAGDLVRFFAQLDPVAENSILSSASRREMIRPQWRYPHTNVERYYGLGVSSSKTAEWEWFGHGGAFQGFASRSATLVDRSLAVSLVMNAVDGPADQWVEGVLHILATFAKGGAPTSKVRDWTGRWWTLWGAADLVPIGDKVVVATPSLPNPFTEASEITVSDEDHGHFIAAAGTARHGEPVRRVRRPEGQVGEIWFGGTRLVPEAEAAAELEARYGG
ncbi:MAG: beta-lactamase family protein [Alphaproteobacteria bacterium]|nr:beta-lactamase family protein [Alphaproteobacteria bacterium]